MKYTFFFLSINCVLLLFTHCNKKEPSIISPPCEAPIQKGLFDNNTIKGMSLVAPRHQWVNDPLVEMAAVNINWVALLPYNSFEIDMAHINFDQNTWWGETIEGIEESMRLAKAQNIKTMIKPQLWSRDLWIGDMNYNTQAEWDSFHQDYTQFICYWAHVADSLEADLFCIGTEIKHSAMNHPTYWRGLIDSIRQIYSGPLTYAPNWDEYAFITFWDKLDYIGIDAYFSLVPDETPSVCALKEAWKPVVQEIEAVQQQYNKPVLFTEWGYLTLDGCAWQTWVLEKDRGSVNINQQAQANAAQALLETFGEKPWWAGGFQWKWYSDLLLSTRSYADDYSPQNKMASQVLQEMYE
ncbi:MAG: glycoside hydrolase family 113 [Aureispira sp.]